MSPIMSQFGPVRLFIFWKVSTCALIWAWALIYFLKSVDPMCLFRGGLLFSTQEYSFYAACSFYELYGYNHSNLKDNV